MKKAVPILIMIIILLTSCNLNDKPSQNNNFAIKIISAGLEDGVFKDSNDFYKSEESTTEEINSPTEETITLGKQNIKAYHIKTIRYSTQSSINVFYSENNNTEIRIYTGNNLFSMSAKNGTALLRFENTELSEQNLLSRIKTYITSYIDIENFDDYVYSCTTSIIMSKPDAAWRENKNYFYIADNTTDEKAEISYYQFEFNKHCQGYETEDRIVVKCTANGDISDLSYFNYNAEWNTFAVSKTEIEKSVSDYLKDAVTKEYKINEYKVVSERLVYRNEKIQLSATYELTLSKNNDEIVILCPVMVIPN